MSEVRIEPLAAADVAAFRALVLDVLAEFGMREDPVLDADLHSPLDAYAHVWVARRDGEVVGSVALRRVDDATYYLKRMYLRSSLRGQGLGARLLAVALDAARQAGARHVQLDTSTEMVAAQRLYERAGFHRTGTRTEAGARDSRCEVLYALDLGAAD
jgi:putative acetyltransferase